MLIFFKDAQADASTESSRLAIEHADLHAKLMALAGLQRLSLRPKKLYHHENGQHLYFDAYTVNGVAGYVFFRESPQSPSPWLVVGIGTGPAAPGICAEALRRFFVSRRM